MKRTLFFIIIILGLFGCKPSAHFEKNIEFENNNWRKFDNLEFNIPVEAGKIYSFEANIITDTNYTRRKLELGFYLYLPGDEERLEDQTIRIRDLEYRALGTKTEKGYQIKKSLKNNLLINESGILRLQIVHHSQYLDNFGINSIKLSVIEK
jgi:gliding motility-associated lipoprotein GldH